jgi:environmental stress-induced protein Ves
MPFTIISADKFNTINWSGGTSTQLYIYPETADYGLRNFDFRLSTAKVDVEKSEFTSLAGVSRKIMILDGKIVISHKDYYSKELKKLDIDEFEGDWQTSSIGICTDFNLMTTRKTKGDLSALVLKEKQEYNYSIEEKCSFLFIYLYSGKISFKMNHKNYVLNQGELLVLSKLTIEKLQISAYESSELIVSMIIS